MGADTLAWVEQQAALLPPVPSLAFIHIPLQQVGPGAACMRLPARQVRPGRAVCASACFPK